MGLRNTVSATQPTLSYRGTRSARNEIAHFNYASSIVSRWGHQLDRQSELETEEEALPLPLHARNSPRQS